MPTRVVHRKTIGDRYAAWGYDGRGILPVYLGLFDTRKEAQEEVKRWNEDRAAGLAGHIL